VNSTIACSSTDSAIAARMRMARSRRAITDLQSPATAARRYRGRLRCRPMNTDIRKVSGRTAGYPHLAVVSCDECFSFASAFPWLK
jgi:hypothetical protein